MRFHTDSLASLPYLTFYWEIISSLQKNRESTKNRFLPTHWRGGNQICANRRYTELPTTGSRARAKGREDARVWPRVQPAGWASFSSSLFFSRWEPPCVTVRNPAPIMTARRSTGQPHPAGSDPLRWTPPLPEPTTSGSA